MFIENLPRFRVNTNSGLIPRETSGRLVISETRTMTSRKNCSIVRGLWRVSNHDPGMPARCTRTLHLDGAFPRRRRRRGEAYNVTHIRTHAHLGERGRDKRRARSFAARRVSSFTVIPRGCRSGPLFATRLK